MAEVIDIQGRLGRLANTVSAKQEERNRTRAALMARKKCDWDAVCELHPDHADFIRAITGAFGKPDFVGVKTDAGEVLMDSRRYDL